MTICGFGQAQESDDRQRQLLLLEISAQALAGGPLFTPDIQHVVGDLECDAQVATVSIERRDGRLGSSSVPRTQPARDGGQCGRFSLDDRKVIVFIEVQVPAMVNLLHLTLANLVRRLTDPAAGAGFFERSREMGKECRSRGS